MNNKQSNQLDMFRGVHKHGTDNQAITNTVLAFANGIATLGQKIVAIETVSGQQSQRIIGVSDDKKALRLVLCGITFANISPVKAYAIATSNNTLREQMNYSSTELKRIQDDQIAQDAQNLLNLVTPLIPALADYGVTNATVSAWQFAINAYAPSIAAPQTAVAHKKNLTSTLKQLFKEANTTCNDFLDPLVISFKANNPDYYQEYLNHRQIKDLGKGGTRIKGNVSEESSRAREASGASILDVFITIVETSAVVKTDIDGNYLFPKVRKGTYTLKAEKVGYITQISPPIKLIQGKTVTVNFKLLRS